MQILIEFPDKPIDFQKDLFENFVSLMFKYDCFNISHLNNASSLLGEEERYGVTSDFYNKFSPLHCVSFSSFTPDMLSNLLTELGEVLGGIIITSEKVISSSNVLIDCSKELVDRDMVETLLHASFKDDIFHIYNLEKAFYILGKTGCDKFQLLDGINLNDFKLDFINNKRVAIFDTRFFWFHTKNRQKFSDG